MPTHMFNTQHCGFSIVPHVSNHADVWCSCDVISADVWCPCDVIKSKKALEEELSKSSPSIKMSYSPGADTDSRNDTMIDAAVKAAAAVDVAIVVVGDSTRHPPPIYFGFS